MTLVLLAALHALAQRPAAARVRALLPRDATPMHKRNWSSVAASVSQALPCWAGCGHWFARKDDECPACGARWVELKPAPMRAREPKRRPEVSEAWRGGLRASAVKLLGGLK